MGLGFGLWAGGLIEQLGLRNQFQDLYIQEFLGTSFVQSETLGTTAVIYESVIQGPFMTS